MRRTVAVFLATSTLLAASCTQENDVPKIGLRPEPRPVAGGIAIVGVLGEPPTLDPYSPRATDLTFAVVRPVYPSLYRITPDGSTEPELARSMEEKDGGVTVTLRRAFWSNGQAITARDVVASVRRARSPSGFALVGQARARSRRAVELVGRVRKWEQALARVAFVLPHGRASRPGGTFGGPLEIASATPGLDIIYKHNPEWTGPKPYLRRVRVTFVTGLLMMLRLLELGRIDAAALPSSVNLGDRLDSVDIDHDEALGYEAVVVDFASSGLNRPERAAIVATIDTKLLAEGLVRDDGRPAHTLWPSPERTAGPFSRALGARSKPQGTQLLLAPAGDELLQLFQRVIDRGLDDAGIDVDLVRLVPSELYEGASIVSGVELRRVAGGPGLSDSPGAVRRLDRYPLFQVETVVGWRSGLQGLDANPSYEGVLHNVEEWWWTGGERS